MGSCTQHWRTRTRVEAREEIAQRGRGGLKFGEATKHAHTTGLWNKEDEADGEGRAA